jgi:polyisoprenoid-binding protein YceI
LYKDEHVFFNGTFWFPNIWVSRKEKDSWMRDHFVLILMSLGSVMVLVLSACQSGSVKDVAVAADPSATLSVEATKAEATPTPEPTPTSTVEAIETLVPTATNEPTMVSTVEPTATSTDEPTVTPVPTAEPGIVRNYTIVANESEVRFHIDEVLFGNPKTVVGRTNQVTGEIMLDLNSPHESEVGPIQVNARELVTDESFRNRALRRQILDSSQDVYQYITFTPTGIEGLGPEAVVPGEARSFNLSGDLQIRDIVRPVTFEMMVTAVSETELHGSGEAIVLRSDYDLRIPSVPGVADVSDEVRLEIDFVAEAAEE